MNQFWSQDLDTLDPYTPGEQPKDKQYIKLNTNENPYPPSDAVLTAIHQASSGDLRLYPDPKADDLKQTIADYYQVEPDSVFIGNGSDEVLAHAFVALFRHEHPLLFPDICYSFYRVYCKLFNINYREIPLTGDFEIDIDDYPVENGGIIFPNPNAPTSKALSLDKISKLAEKHPQSALVVDEAYVDFGAETAIPLTKEHPNILVTQTLSKSRSLAGLRVGFAIGSPALIEGLERVKNSFHPYTLGRPALAGAMASIKDTETFELNCAKITETREWTHQELIDLGFEVIPSSTNFLFTRPPEGHAAEELYLKLKEKGILVRYFNSPRIDQYLRITIGTPEEMQALTMTLFLLIRGME